MMGDSSSSSISNIMSRRRRLGVGIALTILSISFMFWLGGDGLSNYLTPTQNNHGRQLSIEEIQ